MKKSEWLAEGERLFGNDVMEWSFKCPSCGYIAKAKDYKDAGAPSTAVAFSCIGRWMDNKSEAFVGGKGPCDYAGGGLIRINPVEVDGGHYFEFAK